MKRLFFKPRLNIFDIICVLIVASLNDIYNTAWFYLLLAALMFVSIKFENELNTK